MGRENSTPNCLVITHILTRSQPADAGGRIKPGVERKARNPRYAEWKFIQPAEQAAANVEVGAIKFDSTMISCRPHSRAR